MTGTTPNVDTIIQGDCREEMKKLPANSINLIYTDPPYFKVKDEPWDNQWENPAKEHRRPKTRDKSMRGGA
jgi:DNA modification methylase